ncbi:hypothetical protein LK07_17625 [Streptomyces pluripotens]|uniref:HTH-like domain-containing protein n=1 Tax=Streptomyces pluripotens TaxID=1355015 RepID=A0A221P078_9ACTN|nr:hypothetical protein LK06_016470 [Streptomyces pluripotens]ASN25552.1 hypothetical protein LK07_17625 [Streptomyces pluripotens]
MKACRWDFISDHRANFGVKRLCRVLEVSRSGSYRHQATEEARAERQVREAAAVAEIRAIHTEHQGDRDDPTAKLPRHTHTPSSAGVADRGLAAEGRMASRRGQRPTCWTPAVHTPA